MAEPHGYPLSIFEYVRHLHTALPINLSARADKIKALVQYTFPLPADRYPPFLDIPYQLQTLPDIASTLPDVLAEQYTTKQSSHKTKLREIILFPQDNICHKPACKNRVMIVHQAPMEPVAYTSSGIKTVLSYKTTCRSCKAKRSYFHDDDDFIDFEKVDYIYVSSSSIIEKKLAKEFYAWFLNASISFEAIGSV